MKTETSSTRLIWNGIGVLFLAISIFGFITVGLYLGTQQNKPDGCNSSNIITIELQENERLLSATRQEFLVEDTVKNIYILYGGQSVPLLQFNPKN